MVLLHFWVKGLHPIEEDDLMHIHLLFYHDFVHAKFDSVTYIVSWPQSRHHQVKKETMDQSTYIGQICNSKKVYHRLLVICNGSWGTIKHDIHSLLGYFLLPVFIKDSSLAQPDTTPIVDEEITTSFPLIVPLMLARFCLAVPHNKAYGP